MAAATAEWSHAQAMGRAVPARLLGKLQDCSALLADPQRLRQHLAEEGHVYLHGVLDQAEVLAARQEVAERLVAVGELRVPAHDAIATGASRRRELHPDLGVFWQSVSEGASLRRVTHGAALQRCATALLGTAARGQDYVFLRAGAQGRYTGAHCDYPFFTRMTEQVITFWIPLGPVPTSDGPLYILEGSHRFADWNDAVRGFDVARDASRKATFADSPIALAEDRGCRLLSADFTAGDVVAFGMFTWHGAFDNRSPLNRVRLSCDVRYQPADHALDPRYFGPHPTGTTGAGYGELNGAKPLTEPWHVR
ncbi:MAG: phytanoyl-CoA dioxygenase family protein [Gammaproteobacteria bacterium]